ncbi:hypothetical protein L226DRAFT_531175 [Lentinus tigrinus ALCF2SS1-7]|uniref:Uncharacterized protein n=1 Tax=Lentinus tigrinus ALCF2SS1-6 TaxID=1328759 RepID=A0A5C2SN92_9APHY|nr:hypothetical protein L227DRAFT_570581 [Lentinus tigrinus ALCF2SS1-6]RPD79363.1 hypothetical protein L226DRAFT_531175 [Lentinus tigrinus ALCF2SS1-7]
MHTVYETARAFSRGVWQPELAGKKFQLKGLQVRSLARGTKVKIQPTGARRPALCSQLSVLVPFVPTALVTAS